MKEYSSDSEKARAFILRMLIGNWLAPHDVYHTLKSCDCYISIDSTTARMRDLRKAQYGSHDLVKRRRAGTDYFEYTIQQREQEAA